MTLIYIYIFNHRQTASLYITLQCGYSREILEAGIETRLTHTPIEDSTAQLRRN